MKFNWKKIIAIAFAGYVAPTVGAWAADGGQSAFTFGNVIAPHAQNLIATSVALAGLFLNPPHKD